ncbi:hypothetical protein COBT_002589 [Conglomerata obtusa]
MDRFIRKSMHDISNTHTISNKTSKLGKSIIKPFKCIEISPLVDDYYSRLLDWAGDSIVYASDSITYHYNTKSECTEVLNTFQHFGLNSIRIHEPSNQYILGISTGSIQIADLNSPGLAKYHVHKARIGTIEVKDQVVYTGSRDRTIKATDIRMGREIACLKVHLQEVCGLKINATGQLVASGGNDNKLFVHDLRKSNVPLFKAQKHKAAVKALCWSPNKASMLASGGGTADKSVKIWDMNAVGLNDALVRSVDYQSQVCNLHWTKANEIISTHGYSRNDIRIANAGSMKVKGIYGGNGNRTIHFAVDSEEEMFVSGGCDGNLNFWRIHDRLKKTSLR